jgi:hypothetical protein
MSSKAPEAPENQDRKVMEPIAWKQSAVVAIGFNDQNVYGTGVTSEQAKHVKRRVAERVIKRGIFDRSAC